MTEKLTYKPLPNLETKDNVNHILNHGNKNELAVLALSIGEYFPDWKFAQDICLQLADHNDKTISSNACLGLSYIARTKGNLEKHLVKPILIRELRKHHDFKWRVLDAIADINRYMGWKLAHKHLDDK
ncbi:MAG: hypothetical protein AAGE84_14660 [Cyanobacteria bacterium P01_G01_bin.39]